MSMSVHREPVPIAISRQRRVTCESFRGRRRASVGLRDCFAKPKMSDVSSEGRVYRGAVWFMSRLLK